MINEQILDTYNNMIMGLIHKGYRQYDFFNLTLKEKSLAISSLLNVKVDMLKHRTDCIKQKIALEHDPSDELHFASALFSLEELQRHEWLVSEKDKPLIDRYSLIYERKINNDVNEMREEICNEQQEANSNYMREDTRRVAV